MLHILKWRIRNQTNSVSKSIKRSVLKFLPFAFIFEKLFRINDENIVKILFDFVVHKSVCLLILQKDAKKAKLEEKDEKCSF